jgi:hypothetical protein
MSRFIKRQGKREVHGRGDVKEKIVIISRVELCSGQKLIPEPKTFYSQTKLLFQPFR